MKKTTLTISFLLVILGLLHYSCKKDTDDNTENNTTDDFLGDSGTFTDERDGQTYNWVRIGDQIWMAENLRKTIYNDGTAIPNVTDDDGWAGLSTPAFCWYNNDESSYKDTYGALYNWYAVNSGKLAPEGWHVPTDDEWTQLEEYLIANGYNYDGTMSDDKIGKSLAATSGWILSDDAGDVGNDQQSNNSTGFSALPGGYRVGFNGSFFYAGISGTWWNSSEYDDSEAYVRNLRYHYPDLRRYDDSKSWGYSVRCLRN